MDALDESTLTEIEVAADGRVYVFGASRQVLEVLASIGVRERALADRLVSAPRGAGDTITLRAASAHERRLAKRVGIEGS